jgi:hypothetical protein
MIEVALGSGGQQNGRESATHQSGFSMSKRRAAGPTHLTLLVPEETIEYALGPDIERLDVVESKGPNAEAGPGRVEGGASSAE